MTQVLYPELKGTDTVEETCGRCGGSGVYHGPTNARWNNGAGHNAWCFWCNGVGVQRVKVASVRARARREEKAREETAAKAAQRKALRAAFVEAVPAHYVGMIQERRAGLRDGNPLARRADYLLLDFEGGTGDVAAAEFVEAADKFFADFDAVEEGKRPAPEGRVTVSGRVVSVKYQESDYYGRRGAYKMLVEGEGWKAWGTVPSSLPAVRNQVVEFTATFTRSDDDEAFAFFTRPTKGAVLTPAPEEE